MCWLTDLFKKKTEFPVVEQAPNITRTFTSAEIDAIIHTKFPPALTLYLSDTEYHACSKEDIMKFLSLDETNSIKYVAEDMDCDDFSYRLMGDMSTPPWSKLPIGIVWTNLHALNCFIDDKDDFYFIEPQTDNVAKDLEGWQGSTPYFIIM